MGPLKVQEAERIIRRIQKRYDKNPQEEWRVLMGRDSSGRLTQLIGDSTDSWQIKGEMISPRKFAGVGVKLKGIGSGELLDLGEPFYGIRPMGRDLLSELLKGGPSAALKELASLPRTPFTGISKTDAVVEGPILQSRSPIGPVSERQRNLEISLNRGLDNLLRMKHPETRYAYG